MTRADLARVTGLARSTVAQRVDTLLAKGLVYDTGGSVSTGGRPPTVLAFNRDAGVVLVADLGATHARVAVSDLAGTPLAERAADLDIALGPGARPRVDRRALRGAARGGGPLARRRARHRGRRAGPGRVRQRAAGQPADHARLGRLPDPGVVRRPLPRAGARRQRRQHHGPRRAPDALARDGAPAPDQGRHRDRLRHRRRRAHPPRRPRRGRRHRAHPGRRAARTSSAAAGTSAAWRRSPAARPSRTGSRRRARTRRAAATSSASSGAAIPARSAWSATQVGRSARCSPAPSTSSTRP